VLLGLDTSSRYIRRSYERRSGNLSSHDCPRLECLKHPNIAFPLGNHTGWLTILRRPVVRHQQTTHVDRKRKDAHIRHNIDSKSDARPVYAKLGRYPKPQQESAMKISTQMEDAGILLRGSSQRTASTAFPPKEKASSEYRVVHNFMPMNSNTIKLQ
jgi:hypothetical protein